MFSLNRKLISASDTHTYSIHMELESMTISKNHIGEMWLTDCDWFWRTNSHFVNEQTDDHFGSVSNHRHFANGRLSAHSRLFHDHVPWNLRISQFSMFKIKIGVGNFVAENSNRAKFFEEQIDDTNSKLKEKNQNLPDYSIEMCVNNK